MMIIGIMMICSLLLLIIIHQSLNLQNFSRLLFIVTLALTGHLDGR